MDKSFEYFESPLDAIAADLGGRRLQEISKSPHFELPSDLVQKRLSGRSLAVRAVLYRQGIVRFWAVMDDIGWRQATGYEVHLLDPLFDSQEKYAPQISWNFAGFQFG